MPKSPKRILVDLTPLDTPSGPRGIGRYIRELARGLSELPPSELEGIELVGLTSLSWTGSYRITHDLASFDGSPGMEAPTGRDFYVWAYRQRVALWAAAHRIGADVVHIPDPHATPLLFGLTGLQKIVTCHDLIPTRFPDRYFGVGDGGKTIGKRIERRRYRSADLVVAVSDATRRDVCTLLGMPEERVVRVYNGVDIDRWATEPALARAPLLSRLGLGGRPFALYVGGSDWRKNVEGMMGGLAKARVLGADLDLAWAGQLDPGHVAHVERVAQEMGVGSAVKRIGFVTDEELSVLYRESVAHLLVSRLEGFGFTVVEAMAAGCPVLTTREGSLAEVAGDAALTVDPEDHDAIGRALARLAGEPGLREELAAKGRKRAPAFSRAAQAKAQAAAYRRFA